MKAHANSVLRGFILATVLFCFSDGLTLSPTVTTTTGFLRGYLINDPGTGQDVYKFEGIPFAEPPVGKLRLRKTVPKKPWQGEFQATKTAPMCHQWTWWTYEVPMNQSEDCLYMNIWVRKSSFDSKASLPVFFWIHGGGFVEGSVAIERFDGAVLAAYQNVIFVSIQYRLGPAGLAYLGTEEVPGNMAFWDQLEGLKWTHQNIKAFGGDPSKITILGESAGGASVSIQLLSPHARPYIHQASIVSGAVLGEWAKATPAEALHRTNRLLQHLSKKYPKECGDISSIQAKTDCLYNVQPDYSDWNRMSFISETDPQLDSRGVIDTGGLQPVIDGDFIPYDPIQMLADGNFTKVPMLTGMDKNEGTGALLSPDMCPLGPALLPTTKDSNLTMDHFNGDTYRQFLDCYFCFYPISGHPTDPVIKSAIELQYWHNYPSNEVLGEQLPPHGQNVVDRINAAIGDSMLACPVVHWTKIYKQFVPVYQFYFTYRTEQNAQNEPDWFGVKHADELAYTVGEAINDNFKRFQYTAQEKVLTKRVLQYYGNFLRTGNPNIGDSSLADQLPLPPWPELKEGYSLQIDGDGSKGPLIASLKERDCEFWFEHLPKLQARLDGIYEPGTKPPSCPEPNVQNSTASIFKSFNLQSLTLISLFISCFIRELF